MPNDSKKLSASKKKNNDEFYTLYEDVAAELPSYRDQMRGAHILCPCDWDESLDEAIVYASEEECRRADLLTEKSTVKVVDTDRTDSHIEKDINLVRCNFVKFLIAHAEAYGIASISVSGYDPARNVGVRFQDIDYSKYDLVITNPPFSQFRDFIDVMFANDVKFLVIGPQNAITYRDTFQHIMNNEMWIGYHYHLTGFRLPDGTVLPKNHNLPRSCCWWTNLDVSIRHDTMILTEEYDQERNPRYVNFDAIEVGKTKLIPYDWPGLMGVPITFLQKYNPDQFEIVGSSDELSEPITREIDPNKKVNPLNPVRFYLKMGDGYKRMYPRIVIRNRNPRPTDE